MGEVYPAARSPHGGHACRRRADQADRRSARYSGSCGLV